MTLRYRTLSILSLLLFVSGPAASEEAAPAAPFRLANGLQVVLLPRKTVPLVHACLAVGLGEKDEEASGCGRVHLLEHMLLFGGTTARTAEKKREGLRAEGAYLNAHTDHDLMTLEISMPAGAGLGLPAWMREIAFQPAFSTEEMEAEKKVIVEEILQIGDNPETASTDLALQLLFAGQAYGRPLYGVPEVVAATTVGQLSDLHRAYFLPANCVLAVTGDFDPAAMKKAIGESLGGLDPGERPRARPPETVSAKKNEAKREMDIGRAHLKLAFLAPGFHHADRVAMSVLCQLLGQGRNPLLARAGAGGRGLIDNLSVHYFPLQDAGAVLVHAVVKPGNLKRVKADLLAFLGQLAAFSFSSDEFPEEQRRFVTDYLKAGKNTLLLGAEEVGSEGDKIAAAFARSLMTARPSAAESFAERLRKTGSGDLRAVCGRYLTRRGHVTVEIIPGDADHEKEEKD